MQELYVELSAEIMHAYWTIGDWYTNVQFSTSYFVFNLYWWNCQTGISVLQAIQFVFPYLWWLFQSYEHLGVMQLHQMGKCDNSPVNMIEIKMLSVFELDWRMDPIYFKIRGQRSRTWAIWGCIMMLRFAFPWFWPSSLLYTLSLTSTIEQGEYVIYIILDINYWTRRICYIHYPWHQLLNKENIGEKGLWVGM